MFLTACMETHWFLQIFQTSVNSPLKGAQQGGAREVGPKEAVLGRKSSITHNSLHGLSSPTAARPSNRRREPSESYPFPRESIASPPATTQDTRQESQEYSFSRRRTDAQEAPERTITGREKDESSGGANLFGSLRRSGTNPLSAGLNGPSSPWSTAPSNQPMSPMGAFGNLGGLGGTKRTDQSSSKESRFRDLLSKSNADEESQGGGRGLGGLGRLEEDPNDQARSRGGMATRESYGQGSAALLDEDSPQMRSRQSGLRRLPDEPSFGSYAQRAFTDQRGRFDSQHSFAGEQQDSEDPSSPTTTNPYASPQQQSANMRDEGADVRDAGNLRGLGNTTSEMPRDPFSGRAGLDRTASFGMDRGQPFSSGPARGFPSLGGFGGLPGLGGAPDPWAPRSRTGTPNRERAGFGDYPEQNVRPQASFQSPGLGGPFGGGLGSGGAMGRSSRLGSLLPNTMHDQARDDQQMRSQDDPESYDDAGRALGPMRDSDSPYHGARSKFDDFLGDERHDMEGRFSDQQLSSAPHQYHAAPGLPLSHQSSFQQQPSQRSVSMGSSAQSQPPASQQKTMVMPDKIRWIYRDPQGTVQGPWSGLEMHDWYRAGFFSPELLVKKLEDDDYEPLAQLIRRIGNSREPFLVPQIGIPHPSSQGISPWPNPNPVTATSPSVASSTQPPFAGSFPSFGTTLTADQQNALERRKQEEQTLMARQKEHLAYQQVLQRQIGGQQGYSQQLQHHSSTQSLNSQPSYGSMTSPSGFQGSSPPTVNAQGVSNSRFDNGLGLGSRGGVGTIGSGMDNLGQIREEDPSSLFERLDLGRRQFEEGDYDERTLQMLQDRARLEREQAELDMLHRNQEEQYSFSDHRRQEFMDLQSRHQAANPQEEDESYVTQQLGKTRGEHVQEAYNATAPEVDNRGFRQDPDELRTPPRNLSLTEQVQKAASAKQSPATAWPRVPESIPPQSNSPLPAPAARRGGPSLAESLAAESLPQSQSPSVETPTTATSLAPWAKEQQDSHKQPSLKEIQEAEAKCSAQRDQINAAARRAALERESTNQPPPPAPGLPSSSTWGSGESPSTPSAAAASAWAKAAPIKPAPVSSSTKKTLQQIQQEEEAAAKKRKVQAASNGTMAGQIVGTAAQATSGGSKRYADLAGSTATPSPPAATGAWTTVGASGKTKAPVPTPAAPAPPTVPSTGSSNIDSNVASKVTQPTSSASKTSFAIAQRQAQEQFRKWAVGELRSDLHKGIAGMSPFNLLPF